jgi:hypothetical protein
MVNAFAVIEGRTVCIGAFYEEDGALRIKANAPEWEMALRRTAERTLYEPRDFEVEVPPTNVHRWLEILPEALRGSLMWYEPSAMPPGEGEQHRKGWVTIGGHAVFIGEGKGAEEGEGSFKDALGKERESKAGAAWQATERCYAILDRWFHSSDNVSEGEMATALKEAPPYAGIVYRGVYTLPGTKFGREPGAGSELRLDGYRSASRDPLEARYFGNDLLRIKVKNAASIEHLAPPAVRAEKEIVIRPGRYRVTRVREYGKGDKMRRIVDMEEL